MARWIDIAFLPSTDLHRARNFAEELSLSLKSDGLGLLPMFEADAAVTRLRVTAVRQARLQRCLRLIQHLLDKHHLADYVTVSSGHEAV